MFAKLEFLIKTTELFNCGSSAVNWKNVKTNASLDINDTRPKNSDIQGQSAKWDHHWDRKEMGTEHEDI